jgi:hypothetical protein
VLVYGSVLICACVGFLIGVLVPTARKLWVVLGSAGTAGVVPGFMIYIAIRSLLDAPANGGAHELEMFLPYAVLGWSVGQFVTGMVLSMVGYDIGRWCRRVIIDGRKSVG